MIVRHGRVTLGSAPDSRLVDAGSETRRLAFASYLAALDAEEAAAADAAALAACDRDVVHLRIEGSAMPHELRAVSEPCERFNGPPASTSTPNDSRREPFRERHATIDDVRQIEGVSGIDEQLQVKLGPMDRREDDEIRAAAL